MRRERAIISLRHPTNPHALRNSSSVRHIGLYHIYDPLFEIRAKIVPGIESFPERDGHTAVLELRELGNM